MTDPHLWRLCSCTQASWKRPPGCPKTRNLPLLKGSVNLGSSGNSTLGHCWRFHRRRWVHQVRRALWWAWIRGRRTVGRLERRPCWCNQFLMVSELIRTLLWLISCCLSCIAQGILARSVTRTIKAIQLLVVLLRRPDRIRASSLPVVATLFLGLIMTGWLTARRLATFRIETPLWSHASDLAFSMIFKSYLGGRVKNHLKFVNRWPSIQKNSSSSHDKSWCFPWIDFHDYSPAQGRVSDAPKHPIFSKKSPFLNLLV